jgi:alpha-1,2-mannosyltransferase
MLISFTTVLALFEYLAAIAFVFVAALTVYVRQKRRAGQRADAGSDHAVPAVGFLHPNAGGGGGGERVLWVALDAVMSADRRCGITRSYTLYTQRYPAPRSDSFVPPAPGDPLNRTNATAGAGAASPTSRTPAQLARDARDTEHLLNIARQQFGLRAIDQSRLNVVYLDLCWMTEAKYYPRLTLVLQSFVGGAALFWDVARRGATDVLVDTVGVPCSYWLFSLLAGCTVASYVHYPVVSTDMIERVARRTATFNNANAVAASPVLSAAKVSYYRAFARLYRWAAGNFATVVMTNSSWTNDHIRSIWRRGDTTVVFPPCGIARFVEAIPSIAAATRQDVIVSVGQFRPEKDHPLQVAAFATAVKRKLLPPGTLLYLIGGCRDSNDHRRADQLEVLAKQLGVEASVRVERNVPAERVVELLKIATIGLHTMRDEHFGIVVAEYQAAGCVPVAHNSAGPKRDIVRDGETGVLATTEEEFAVAMGRVFKLRQCDPAAWERMSTRARESSLRFSDKYFARAFTGRLAPVLALTLLPEEDDDGVKLCC